MEYRYISPLNPNYDELMRQQEEQAHELKLKEMEIQSGRELQAYKNQQIRENIFLIGALILVTVIVAILIKKISSKVKSKNKDNIHIVKEKLDLLKSLYDEGILTEEEFNKRKKQLDL